LLKVATKIYVIEIKDANLNKNLSNS
jgi:hypothetical protein